MRFIVFQHVVHENPGMIAELAAERLVAFDFS